MQNFLTGILIGLILAGAACAKYPPYKYRLGHEYTCTQMWRGTCFVYKRPGAEQP